MTAAAPEARLLRRYAPWRVAALGVLALLCLVPVTLPVPVLRGLVQERFGVSELLTSLFMSINMIGAVLTAPLAGALADRLGRRCGLIVAALVLDALCFVGLTLPIPFGAFLVVRFLEGCCHIGAISLLMALASQSLGTERRGRAMGVVGAGLLLGVAVGAPLGGAVGRESAILPLQLGAAILVATAILAALVLRETAGEGERRPGLGAMLAALRTHRLVVVPLLFAFADRFTVGFYTTTFSLYLSRIHQAEPATIGLLIALFMLPFAVLSVPFGWISERTSRVGLLCFGSLAYGIGTASLVHWSADALPVVMAAIGTAAAAMFVPSMIMTADLTPLELRSTALGAFNAAGSLGFIVGPVTGGLVSEAVASAHGWDLGYHAAFWVAGGAKILLAVVGFPILWRRRGEASPAPLR